MDFSTDKLVDERLWRAVTGFTQSQFQKLLLEFETAYLERFGKGMTERAKEFPMPLKLNSYSKLLLFTLYSLKSGQTYDCLGFACDMDGSTAKRNQAIGLQLLKAALTKLNLLPKQQFKDVAEFEAYFSKYQTLILDGTEHRIQRPKNNDVQAAHYSGKKKHTRSK
jgi:hypothetical protein